MESSGPWYSAVPIGKTLLMKRVKDICQRAGIQGNKTNHSLRATGATAMYEAEVPESLIQDRSLKALRVYKRSTEAQHQEVSAVLSSRTTFHSEMSRSQATHFAPNQMVVQLLVSITSMDVL